MRFKSELRNIRTFSKLVAALSSLEKIAWVRLDDETVRFTVIPDTGTQVWASLSMDFIFDSFALQSNEPQNTINLELPLGPLQRALKSALNASSASLRLTKKDGMPVLSMTITALTAAPANPSNQGFSRFGAPPNHAAAAADPFGGNNGTSNNNNSPFGDDDVFAAEPLETTLHREREKIITQDIPVRVLHPDSVEAIMQPKVREPDVHIQLPPLNQLKAVSDRFTKLAAASSSSSNSATAIGGGGSSSSNNNNKNNNNAAGNSHPKLDLSATMHGALRLRLVTDTLNVESRWDGLENPELDPDQLPCPLEEHPSTLFREAGPGKWAGVRVDGKDWSKVLSVGRLEGRVIACFADENALILYVYVPQYDEGGADVDDAVLTYYVSSFDV